MMEDVIVKTDSHVIHVNITSNCNSFTSERKFEKSLTLQSLKEKLELITGARNHLMTIEVFDRNDVKVCDLKGDDALVGSFPIESQGFRLHVTDPERNKDEFDENSSNVPKFELSQEEYAKKTGTVQDFLKKNKMGKYNPEEVKRMEAEKAAQEKEEREAAALIKIGDRCEVKTPANPPRRGEVLFVGEVHFKGGIWVGVKYDEPFGKNDGSFEGKRYFDCQPKYGAFVRVGNVEVGDFPEEGFSDDEI